MAHIFEEVTGSAGSLSFQFNGQFALKNYNVEIVNGNRLKVVSTANEMFSLLEADISEVEINGVTYTDPNAAQIALTSLVHSDAEPVVLTKEQYMALAAAAQGQDRGTIAPNTATPTGGWQVGWYKPTTSSASPGTNYPNQGNQKAISGFSNKLYYDGTTWLMVREKFDRSFLPQFADLQFPVTNPSGGDKVQCVDNFVPYQLLDGKTSTSADTPSTSPTMWKPLEVSKRSENQFIFQKARIGYFDNHPALVANAAYVVSNDIPCKVGDSFRIGLNPNAFRSWNVYDSNNVWKEGGTTLTEVITVNYDGYFRFDFAKNMSVEFPNENNDYLRYFQVVKNRELLPSPHYFPSVENLDNVGFYGQNLDKLKEQYDYEHLNLNLLDVSKGNADAYINGGSYNIGSLSGYTLFGWIRIKEKTRYNFVNFTSFDTFGYSIFDINRTLLNPIGIGTQNPKYFDSPEGAFWLFITIKTDDVATAMISEGYAIPDSYKPLNTLVKKHPDSILPALFRNFRGKKWHSFGDSITNLGYYQKPVIELLGIGTHVNYGISGSIIPGASNGPGGAVSINIQFVNQTPDADLITINGGTNGLLSAGMGSIDDTTNETFYGAMNRMVKWWLDNNPNAALVLISPIQRKPRATTTAYLKEIRDGFVAIAQKYNLPLVDWFYESGFIEEKAGIYSYDDGVHPNQVGANRMAVPLIKKLMEIPLQ